MVSRDPEENARLEAEYLAEHQVRKWRRGAPCPRCGGAMVEGERLTLWD